MIRRTMALALTAAVLGLMTAPATLAAPPIHEKDVESGTQVVTDLCPFPVTVGWTQASTPVFRFDADGNLIGIEVQIREQDTFTAAHTLVGEPFTFHVSYKLDADGNWVVMSYTGVMEKVVLPDGSMFVAAGIASFPDVEFVVLTPDNGRQPNIDAFCAALGA